MSVALQFSNVKHFSEADLLGTWYTAPGESLPVMMHLADCPDCAARYERLEKKMHALVACPHAHAQRRMFIEAAGGILIAAVVTWTLLWRYVV